MVGMPGGAIAVVSPRVGCDLAGRLEHDPLVAAQNAFDLGTGSASSEARYPHLSQGPSHE